MTAADHHVASGTDVQMRVLQLEELAPDIFELTLDRGDFPFDAGDCVVIFGENGVSRPYSIASAPTETELRILFRKMTGGQLTTWLCRRVPGDILTVSYPFGEFRPATAAGDGAAPNVFVATGVGIAPFLSCLRGSAVSDVRPVCLYGVRALGDAVHRDVLHARSDLSLAVSRETVPHCYRGRVDALLKETVDLSVERDYYLCGVDAMVYEVSDWLDEQGIPSHRVHTEVFFTTGA